MLYAFLFFIELLSLFLLSKNLINHVFSLFHKITKSRKISIYLLSVLFFPGTLIHELSHYFMSILLFVPVGNMNLFPKIVGDGVKLGSVQIAKTDPIRRTLIGMAPFLFGSILLVGIFLYALQNDLFSYKLAVIVISYLVFEIGNTMFSSKKDMEGAIELLITLLLLAAIFFFVGVRLPAFNLLEFFASDFIQDIFQKADLYLVAPIGIDVTVIFILRLLKI